MANWTHCSLLTDRVEVISTGAPQGCDSSTIMMITVVVVQNQPITHDQSYKYLGVHIDRTLTRNIPVLIPSASNSDILSRSLAARLNVPVI